MNWGGSVKRKKLFTAWIDLVGKSQPKMPSLDELYQYYEVLSDAKDKAGQHEKEFLAVIEAVKGGSFEKRLASQLIAKFFKYFPQHTDSAMNAQLDLCEDEDVNIRKQAIRDMPAICKESPENLPRIADVLTQLLQTEDLSEQNLVQASLLTLMKSDTKGTLQGIFTQIANDDEHIREKAIKFLALKIKVLGSEYITAKLEEYIVEESKKVLTDVTCDEFLLFMTILSSLTCMQTQQGRRQLVTIISEQAGFDVDFDALDADIVERVESCTVQALPMFSKNVPSNKYMEYYLDQIVCKLLDIPAGESGQDPSLEMMKHMSEMAQWCPGLEKLPERIGKLFLGLLNYLPLPPADVIEVRGDKEANGDAAEPKLQFTQVECLLYTLHQLARNHPDFLGATENEDVAARMKDFKIRLQYMARSCQSFVKQLRSELQGKKPEELKTAENKVKIEALKCTNNIHTMIKDLMHIPPSYKATIRLSWKLAVSAAEVPTAGTKRPSIDGKSPVRAKTSMAHMDREVYQPPTGKYSERAGTAPEGVGNNGGNRRGGRGAWRGRGGRW